MVAGGRLHALGGITANNAPTPVVSTGTVDASTGSVAWVANASLAIAAVLATLLGCKSSNGDEDEPDKPFKQCIAGVTTHVLEAKELKDNKLYEIARNFYVEADDGTVCYFGEDVAFYENDKVVDNDGTWRAGVGGAKPGVIMPAKPTTDQAYFQENAPGIAQDMGRVAGTSGTMNAAGVSYKDVVTIKDGNPLDACEKIEDKVYLPGVGEAGDTVKKLVSFTPGK